MNRLFFLFAAMLSPFLLFAGETEETEPPVPSLPPYQEGALPLKSGLMVQRSGKPDLNLRIVNGKMRLYWIDDEGLVTKPDATEVSVRFTRSLRGNDFHRFVRLGDEAGFGTPHVLPAPHIYNGLLILKSDQSEEPEVHAFRYTTSMNAVAEPPAP